MHSNQLRKNVVCEIYVFVGTRRLVQIQDAQFFWMGWILSGIKTLNTPLSKWVGLQTTTLPEERCLQHLGSKCCQEAWEKASRRKGEAAESEEKAETKRDMRIGCLCVTPRKIHHSISEIICTKSSLLPA